MSKLGNSFSRSSFCTCCDVGSLLTRMVARRGDMKKSCAWSLQISSWLEHLGFVNLETDGFRIFQNFRSQASCYQWVPYDAHEKTPSGFLRYRVWICAVIRGGILHYPKPQKGEVLKRLFILFYWIDEAQDRSVAVFVYEFLLISVAPGDVALNDRRRARIGIFLSKGHQIRGLRQT
jgi:hypothetical protein